MTTDEQLARWAAEHAPSILIRAEAEAVAVLREALVAAALGDRSPAEPAPVAAPAPAATPAPSPQDENDSGELLWAYCVLDAADGVPDGARGVDESGRVERVEASGLAALVSRVPRREFGEEPLRHNLNELAWLERVARAHESVLDLALGCANIVPLRLCTLYESEDAVRQMLDREQDPFADALEYLAGRQEWSVKMLIDSDVLAEQARTRSPDASALQDEADARAAGGAYMFRRRLERQVREQAHSLAAEAAERVHTRLADWSLDAVTRSPQNRELSGHEGEMVLNGAYLVEADRVDELRGIAAALEAEHQALGARIEVTGPWPPYNFVPGGGTAAIA